MAFIFQSHVKEMIYSSRFFLLIFANYTILTILYFLTPKKFYQQLRVYRTKKRIN